MKTLIRCASLVAIVAVVLLLHDGGHASNPFAVAVANAATRCPDGFTVKVHGLPAGSDPTSSLSASCVLDLGIPAGAKGSTGPAGTPGVAGTPGTNGVSGYGPVVKAINLNSSKSNIYRTSATAKCPAGKKAISGGYSITASIGGVPVTQTAAVRAINLNSSKSNIYKNQPTPDGNGWTVEAVTTVKGSKPNGSERALVTLKVTVICAVVS